MDAREILDRLTHAEGLPREALKAAAERREEMVPVFLGAIEGYLALEPAARAKPTPLFFICHLLGDWRETSAYGPLARLLRCPKDEIEAILGDGITSTSHRVMAAVFDGDPRPLYDIILDPEAEEFIRSRMCEALAMVVRHGKLDRADAARFLRDAFMNLQPQAQCFVWHGWQSAIAMLGLEELKPLVKKAFDRGFVDRNWLGFGDFEADLEHGIEHPGKPRWENDGEYTLFGDTIEELSRWHCFSDTYEGHRSRARRAASGSGGGGAAVNPFKGVGRNDPCPCGSGRKFKKCCLR